MLTDQELKSLHSNQRLLVQELQSRGVDVSILVLEMELLKANFRGHQEFILDRDSSINPYPASIITSDKALARVILQDGGLTVPEGKNFLPGELDAALRFAQNLKMPLVAKPCHGSHGDQVYMWLGNLHEVSRAIEKILSAYPGRSYLIEEQFNAPEYRIFISRKGDFAVLNRDPASIVGDGSTGIFELAERESARRMNPRTTALCPIRIDDVVINYLKRQGLDLQSVPAAGEKVYLRPNSNVAQGGMCEDVSAKVHPDVIEIAKRALSCFHGLPFAGVDFMSLDITAPQEPDTYRIIEVNSAPGIHMHMRPGKGAGRNVAAFVADMIFPESR
jgi:cyanophycin synthetase